MEKLHLLFSVYYAVKSEDASAVKKTKNSINIINLVFVFDVRRESPVLVFTNMTFDDDKLIMTTLFQLKMIK